MGSDQKYLEHKFNTYQSANPWVGGWTVGSMREAIEAHDRGSFYTSSAASVKVTQYAPIFGALRQRVGPPEGLPISIVGGATGLDGLVRAEVEEQFADDSIWFPPGIIPDLLKGLALMGFVVLQHVQVPRTDGSMVDVKTSVWPTAAVWWDSSRNIYQALTLDGPIDITDGDVHWSLVGQGETPHLNGAIRPLGLEYVEAAFAKRDRNGYSDAHGHPKPVGFMPPKMVPGSKEGKEFTETVRNLPEPGAGGVFMHGSDIKMLEASSDTSAVFQQILDSTWTYVACALLGSDGTMSKGTGGVYTSPTFAGVKIEIIRADVKAIKRALNRGRIRHYVQLNYGGKVKQCPRLEMPMPHLERDARAASYAKRAKDLSRIIKGEQDAGFLVDQARVDTHAAALDIEAPTLAEQPKNERREEAAA